MPCLKSTFNPSGNTAYCQSGFFRSETLYFSINFFQSHLVSGENGKIAWTLRPVRRWKRNISMTLWQRRSRWCGITWYCCCRCFWSLATSRSLPEDAYCSLSRWEECINSGTNNCQKRIFMMNNWFLKNREAMKHRQIQTGCNIPNS